MRPREIPESVPVGAGNDGTRTKVPEIRGAMSSGSLRSSDRATKGAVELNQSVKNERFMRGKTVVITGGTFGIGEVAAVALAKMGRSDCLGCAGEVPRRRDPGAAS